MRQFAVSTKALIQTILDETKKMTGRQLVKHGFDMVLACGLIGVGAKLLFFLDHAPQMGDVVIHKVVVLPLWPNVLDSAFVILTALYFFLRLKLHEI
jgi:hypothetical protein